MSEDNTIQRHCLSADVIPININAAPLRDDGAIVNVILVKNSHYGNFPNVWSLPRGYLVSGESLEQCAARVLKEETGLIAQMLMPVCVCSKPNRFPGQQIVANSYMTVLMSTPDQPLCFAPPQEGKKVVRFKLKGAFVEKEGVLSVVLTNGDEKSKIEFSAKFGRGAYGLVTTDITYKKGEGYSSLAFDHAEMLARAILKAPDLILPTKTKPIDTEGQEESSPTETQG